MNGETTCLSNEAYQFEKMGDSLMRIFKAATLVVVSYASSERRPCNPFNPLLGETYEANFPERGIRFIYEKGWKLWREGDLKSKFWCQSIVIDSVRVLTLEFDDGVTFTWCKVIIM